jgi:hypothetical protein
MPIRLKFLIYRWHIVIVILLVFAAILAPIIFKRHFSNWQAVIPLVGGLFAFVYAVERQKLNESRLFRELFSEFNGRYDELGGGLNRILRGNNEAALSSDDIDILFRYFNLCAEEFLYFRKGYIDPVVWNAWSNGMKTYFRSGRIRKLWAEELESNSYYGFKLPTSQNGI